MMLESSSGTGKTEDREELKRKKSRRGEEERGAEKQENREEKPKRK